MPQVNSHTIWRDLIEEARERTPNPWGDRAALYVSGAAVLFSTLSTLWISVRFVIGILFFLLIFSGSLILIDMSRKGPWYSIWQHVSRREAAAGFLLTLCVIQFVSSIGQVMYGDAAMLAIVLGLSLGLVLAPVMVEGAIKYIEARSEARSRESSGYEDVQAGVENRKSVESKLLEPNQSVTAADIASRDHFTNLVDGLAHLFKKGSLSETEYRRGMAKLMRISPEFNMSRKEVEEEMTELVKQRQASAVPDESCPECGSERVLKTDMEMYPYECAVCDRRFGTGSSEITCPRCGSDRPRRIDVHDYTHHCDNCQLMFDNEKRERVERLQNGKPISSNTIEKMVQAEYDSVDIFRVVNQGPVAYVGAKQGGLLSKTTYLVLEVDVVEGVVVSEDTFTGSNGKKQAQKKLDGIEGINVDRSRGKNLLEMWAEYEELDQKLFVDESKTSSGGQSRPSLGSRLIGVTKKAGDVNSGDWFDSPQCPNCGSQKVGRENDNAYQCRDCGHMIHTGVDISWDVDDS